MVYRVSSAASTPANSFTAYANLTGASQSECARMCYERFDFCAASQFVHAERKCVFSFRWISCRSGEDGDAAQVNAVSDNFIHCIKCVGE